MNLQHQARRWSQAALFAFGVEPLSTYVIREAGTSFHKIGRTNAADARVATLRNGNPRKLILVWQFFGDCESDLHAAFAKYRVRGEWFDLTLFSRDQIIAICARISKQRASCAGVLRASCGRQTTTTGRASGGRLLHRPLKGGGDRGRPPARPAGRFARTPAKDARNEGPAC